MVTVVGDNGLLRNRNRRSRRNFKTQAQVEGKNKNYYTTKRYLKRRKKNGKTIRKSRKVRK